VVTEVLIEDPRWEAARLGALADAAARATLSHLGLDPDAFEISVLGCDDARIASLNTHFRDKKQPTNVLSWPGADRAATADGAVPAPPRPGPDAELGDIAIAFDTCAAEAAAVGLSMADHATHLLVHATLHLLGYDHIRDLDATLMEATEVAILGKMGVADPY
jgi:probable rRNA maturation factor